MQIYTVIFIYYYIHLTNYESILFGILLWIITIIILLYYYLYL